MIANHVLFPLSYPRSWLKRQESNLRLQVKSLVLSMSYIPLRFAEHGHAMRTAPVRFTSLDTRRPEGARASNGKARRKKGRVRGLTEINEQIANEAIRFHSAGV